MHENKAYILEKWMKFHNQEKYLIMELAESTSQRKTKDFKKFLKNTQKMKNNLERDLLK